MKALLLAFSFGILTLGCQSTVPVNAEKPAQPQTEKLPETTSRTEPEKAPNSNSMSQEWKGRCRKHVNESGQEIKVTPIRALQSSYIFEGRQVIWFVKSYTDSTCDTFLGGSRSTFNCDSDPVKVESTCTQKWFFAFDGGMLGVRT